MRQKEYNRIKSEFKIKVSQICKEKKLKYKFVNEFPIKNKKENILYICIAEYGYKLHNKDLNRLYDYIFTYSDYCKDGLMSDKPNMKLAIESIINSDAKNACCGICYESDVYLSNCAECNFYICRTCHKKVSECPQCRIVEEQLTKKRLRKCSLKLSIQMFLTKILQKMLSKCL